MNQNLFFQLLNQCVVDAEIRFLVEGSAVIVGARSNDQSRDDRDVSIRVYNKRFFARVLSYGNLGIGEAYMDQDFEMEKGTLQDFLSILLRNRLDQKIKKDPLLALKIGGIRLVNALRGKQGNVQSHYDLGDELFEAFLDSTLTYSCGYVRTPEDDLDQLQVNKLDRICQKLRLQHRDHLLDIGCGYGGLLIYAAKNYGITGTGVTISRRHFERGNANIAQEGLADRIRIEFKDFAAVKGCFDKVVSVGMLEHVPRREYARYFNTIRNVLTPQGMGLVHAVGCNSYKNEHDPFIQKYIFPGSGQPRLSEIATHLERNRLAILDVENMLRHYGYTIRKWLARFQANRKSLSYGKPEAFMRMWEYYLCCCIAAAFASDSALYQVLFTKDYAAPIPLQRV
jgi:cyclopropane-fatty-acyl-phospholipid synthase